MPKENSSVFSKNNAQNSLVRSSLIRLLIKLSSATAKQFKAWHKQQGSPNRDAFLILKYILSYYPTFDSPKLAQAIAFKKIFGKIDYDYRRLMKGVSQVHLDLKQYLIKVELATDDFLNDYLLAKVYTKYNLLHERQLLLNKKLLSKKEVQQPGDFFEVLHWQDLAFFSEGKTTNQDKNTGIEHATDALDWYYLGRKLKYACEISTQQKLFNRTYEIRLIQAIVTFCEQNESELPLYHQAYFTAWKLINQPDNATFNQLNTLFANHYQAFKQEDQLILLTHLINYTVTQIRTNSTEAPLQAFDLYDFGIQKSIFIINSFFIGTHFNNIISIATSIGKPTWVKQLLSGIIGSFVKNRFPSTYNLALARTSFAKKDYNSCITHLLEVDYSIFSFSFRARIYQIACFYELKEPPHFLEVQCKSFESYLHRNSKKYPDNVRACLNFIYLVRKLNDVNSTKIQLQEMFDTIRFISFQTWLQTKINELP